MEAAIEGLPPGLARQIVSRLQRGVVPAEGVEFFSAGRERWLASLGQELADLADADSRWGIVRILSGRNGDGKTHLMTLLGRQAQQAGFAVSFVTVSRETPLDRWDRIYRELGTNLRTGSRPDARGVGAVFDPRAPDPQIGDGFAARAEGLRRVPRIFRPFAQALYQYCTESVATVDEEGDLALLGSWLQGEEERGGGADKLVRTALGPENGARMVESLVLALVYFGFRGLVVLLDEVESTLGLPRNRRANCYETVRRLIDDGSQRAHVLTVLSATPPMFSDEDRGFFSYPALRSRIDERIGGRVNYDGQIIDLTRTPLTDADYAAIGRSIRVIHERGWNWSAAAQAPDSFIEAAASVAAAGQLTLTYSPTRVFVKLITETLQLARQNPEFHASAVGLDLQFDQADQELGPAGTGGGRQQDSDLSSLPQGES